MINQVVIDGYIGKDLELKTTQSLKKYAVFNLCQNRYNKINDDYAGEWHHAIAWNKTAENLIAKAHKGSKVVLAGEQRSRIFLDKHNNKVTYDYILVDSFDVLTNQNKDLEDQSLQNAERAEAVPAETSVTENAVEKADIDELPEDPFTDEDMPF
ncbi:MULTISPECIES: single-stranded DNA-binding protein [Lactobacillus]|uniref:Single-stranded DNA-binding protein n=1 Tax=Lactobacillus xujianguonis TaxID=2495899 RepID=A0A437SWH7_9LACO|nr:MULTISPECIES: single-stranded DNA-binding protein [Lactobacillus]RVU71210.1 single-stranded DNA-binding protein [Lactobacillus xujianguonis]